jgi:ATPase subunit of ABC transporter with duplicated ATPase domains
VHIESSQTSLDWRLRLGSVKMVGTMLLKLCDARLMSLMAEQKVAAEMQMTKVNEATLEQQERLEEVLGKQRHSVVFALLYTLRADVHPEVSDLAWRVWKLVTAVSGHLVAQVMPTVVSLLSERLVSAGAAAAGANTAAAADDEAAKQMVERRSMALRTVEHIVGVDTQLGDAELTVFLPLVFTGFTNSASTPEPRQAAALLLHHAITTMHYRRVGNALDSLIPVMRRFVADDDTAVRDCAFMAYDTLYDRVGKRALYRLLPSLLQEAKENEAADGVDADAANVPLCAAAAFIAAKHTEEFRPFLRTQILRDIADATSAPLVALRAETNKLRDVANRVDFKDCDRRRNERPITQQELDGMTAEVAGLTIIWGTSRTEAEVDVVAADDVDVGIDADVAAPLAPPSPQKGPIKSPRSRSVSTKSQRELDADVAALQETPLSEQRKLVDCNPLTLGFFGKILLYQTSMTLHVGHRYGIVGANGVGKSTLLRRVADCQLPNWPKDVRTMYIEHEIDGDTEVSCVDFLLAQPADTPQTPETCRGFLTEVGFPVDLQEKLVCELSGGWRMRLALARSLLLRVELLILDEPTNHLDVNAVAWLTEFLQKLTDVTMLIVSHDPPFLDAVATDVLHYHEQKLDCYRGNFTKFGKSQNNMDAASLVSAKVVLRFRLPEPGYLQGVKSRTRRILCLQNADYAYAPDKPNIINKANCSMSMNSRVGVWGANGAGKSTLIKMLAGESVPSNQPEGRAWRHHNLRIAYVAQHSFHHLENFMDMTPIDYIRKRFKEGLDNESAVMAATSDAFETQLDAGKLSGDYEGRQIEELLGRVTLKKSNCYEVKWKNFPDTKNSWLTQLELQMIGANKLVQQCDEKLRVRASGMDQRALDNEEIIKHLGDFGLDKGYCKGACKQLSGGQRSRVVLAAAMWTKPHLLVLDEPTNYLDAEAINALSAAVNKFKGACIMISHNLEFLQACCPTLWLVKDNKLVIEGKTDDVVETTAVAAGESAGAVNDTAGAAAADKKEKAALKKSSSRDNVGDTGGNIKRGKNGKAKRGKGGKILRAK